MNKIPLVGETKTKILYELGGSGRKSASEIAAVLQIQVSAVRKHLDALHSSGIVTEEFVKDGVGRPKKLYSLSEFGRELFPRQYELVLNSLIEKLVASKDRTFVESMLRRVASDIVRTRTPDLQDGALEQATFQDRVAHLGSSMSAFGFETTTIDDAKSGKIVFVSHNCPLYKAAKKYPDLMCKALHAEMIRTALGADSVRLEGCLLAGDSTCVHSVQKKIDRI